MFTYKKKKLFYSSTYFLIFALNDLDLISGLHIQIQTWHLPLRLCIHAKYYVKSGLTNVLKNANKTKTMHLFSTRIANFKCSHRDILEDELFYIINGSVFTIYGTLTKVLISWHGSASALCLCCSCIKRQV